MMTCNKLKYVAADNVRITFKYRVFFDGVIVPRVSTVNTSKWQTLNL